MPSSLTACAHGTEAAPGMWPAALGALLLVAGGRDHLAGELGWRAHVDQLGGPVERSQHLLTARADRLVAGLAVKLAAGWRAPRRWSGAHRRSTFRGGR